MSNMDLEIGNLTDKIRTYLANEIDLNEQNTKMAFIMPLISILGYDIFNPLEVDGEPNFDFKETGGNRVDYAILINQKPLMIIEAKKVNIDLNSNHISQLRKYYTTNIDTKYGILTNGIKYLFFTDIQHQNIMDEVPFYEIDLTNLIEEDIYFLKLFSKEKITKDNGEQIKSLSRKSKLKKFLLKQEEKPDGEFLDFLGSFLSIHNLNNDELVSTLKDLRKITITKEEKVENESTINKQNTDESSLNNIIGYSMETEDEMFENQSSTFLEWSENAGGVQQTVFLSLKNEEHQRIFCALNNISKNKFFNDLLSENEEFIKNEIKDAINKENFLTKEGFKVWSKNAGGIQTTVFFTGRNDDLIRKTNAFSKVKMNELINYLIDRHRETYENKNMGQIA